MNVIIDGRLLTKDHLRLILRHYDAITILIQSALKNKDYTAISEWDEARRVKIDRTTQTMT